MKTMWEQNYYPVAGSLGYSALVAAIPLLILFYMLGVRRKPSWMAALAALGSAVVLALGVLGMPAKQVLASAAYGAGFGLFPIGWTVLGAITLYRVTVDTGQFEIIKDSLASLSGDRRLQALLIAFSFGAFLEGAAGAGTPVAIGAALLAGLGFPPFYAAYVCLLANTVPSAFGPIGIPMITLAGVAGLPVDSVSAMTGRLCSLFAIITPAYMVVVMAGFRGALEVLPAILACGVTFAAMLLWVSNTMGPELGDILSGIVSIAAMVTVMKLWRPARIFRLPGDAPAKHSPQARSWAEIARAWSPYLLLVVLVLLWGFGPVKIMLNAVSIPIEVPGLHQMITRVPPVVAAPEAYSAVFNFNWLSAAGTACFLAASLASLALGMSPKAFLLVFMATLRQLALPLLTIASVLALAFLMNYSGMTSILGLAFAATGAAFPFFSAMLGWLGVFLSGSNTSSNALFGNLQVVTANAIGLNPVLTASSNAAGGLYGKMISLQSIAMAIAATGLAASDEGKLFRATLRHSLILAAAVGLTVLAFAYVFPQLVPVAPA